LGYNIPDTNPAVEQGEAWFRRLSPSQQEQRMGSPMFKAWRAGKVRFADLSRPYSDQVYGEMLREASLKDILGPQAKQYYRANNPTP
jgi:hypothetical protein